MAPSRFTPGTGVGDWRFVTSFWILGIWYWVLVISNWCVVCRPDIYLQIEMNSEGENERSG